MRKAFLLMPLLLTAALLFPRKALAAGVSLSISGPDTLQTGQTGTYTVRAAVGDAAAVQATLHYDSGFFELVSGNPKGEWDSSRNESATVTLITVTLKCVGATGSSGSLSLSDMKSSRLTGGDPPTEAVSCSGGSKTVSNPAPTPTPSPRPVLTPAPTRRSTPVPTATPVATPTAAPTSSPAPAPTATPDAWAAVKAELAAAEGSAVAARPGSVPIPAAVLELVRKMRCVLTLDLGNCLCTIDGRDIGSVPAEGLDPTVSLKKDAALSAAAGGFDAWQIHFIGQGELPGKFAYRFHAEGSRPDDVLYLYRYYEKAGVVEGVRQAAVDADGYVTFEFYYGSAYFVSGKIIDTAMNPFASTQIIVDIAPVETPAAAPGVPVKTLILCAVGAAALAAFGTWAVMKRLAWRRAAKPGG